MTHVREDGAPLSQPIQLQRVRHRDLSLPRTSYGDAPSPPDGACASLQVIAG